jgi:predicted dehydrogenase
MTAAVNPLRLDPAISAARERVESGDLGQLLAVYAVARARHHLDDPLTTLGLPLVQELLETLGEAPVAVATTSMGSPGSLEHWSLILEIASGVRISIDLGAGLGSAQASELDLRIEWSGAERAILVEPAAVAVTVLSSRGAHRESAEIAPIAVAVLSFAETAREIAADPPATWQVAAGVIEAARRSAATGTRVML